MLRADGPMSIDQDEQALERRAMMSQLGATSAPGLSPGVSPGIDMGQKAPEQAKPAAPAVPSLYQSDNASVAGYLQEAMGAKLGDIRKIGDDAGRKSAAEAYIRSLVPEIEKRGGKVGDIRNEKIQIDGQWRDLVRDIDGVAEAQYIVPDEGGPARSAAAAGQMMGMPAPAAGSAVPTDMSTYEALQRRLQEILGPQSVDRQALLAQMTK